MRISENGLKLLMEWEGCKLTQYRDAAGLPTIGCGHLVRHEENFSKGVTQSQALELLATDLERFEKCINSGITVPLSQNQFDALVIFSFNIGPGAFNRSSLRLRLNQGAYEEVPRQLMVWTRAGGKVCQGLVKRRQNEVKLWNST